MEPNSSQTFRASVADESELSSLLTSSSFPWDLSDSEDYEALSKEFDDEAVRNQYQVSLYFSFFSFSHFKSLHFLSTLCRLKIMIN